MCARSCASPQTPTAEFFRTIGDIRGKISELHSKMKGDGTGDESSLKALFTQQHTQVIVRDEDRKCEARARSSAQPCRRIPITVTHSL